MAKVHTDTPDTELTIDDIPQEYLEVMARELQFSVPWQYDADDPPRKDADGVTDTDTTDKDDHADTREVLQALSWIKFQRTPQVNTAVRGLVGRLTGYGFESSSDIDEIQECIEKTELDPRNRLYNYWPKYVGRAFIEGELFIILTCHDSGFIEVDFLDPAAISGDDGLGDDSGIIFHPSKTTMPLIYNINVDDNHIQIPSIFIARYPELLSVARQQDGYSAAKLKTSYPQTASGKPARRKQYKEIGGFNRFVVAWDKSFVTKRNIGHVRTVLEWLEYWENLKKYEIDHKKSAGAYAYVVTFKDVKAWMLWMKLPVAEKQATGIAAKKTPGGTMVLGPGMDMKIINPTLPNISDSDTDIMDQVTSGLNEPMDVSSGNSRSQTFAAVNATRGPMSDRTSDEIAYFERFLRHDFWGSIFFLKSKINEFPEKFPVREARSFKKQKPVFKTVKKLPEMLIDISFPTSEINDLEARSRGLLGVKHGSLIDTLNIPPSENAKRLGFENYRKMRLLHATEEDKYPKLISTMEAESQQEKALEPPAKPNPPKTKGAKKDA